MEAKNIDEIHGETEIFIYPGYEIRTAKGIFTNFHLPKSTLLLLVSTFTGQAWKEIYEAALANNYRFLSYGDSSLILR
jgi:S-adenosylmethionine:tRNA ribosyltransferase-isomerase